MLLNPPPESSAATSGMEVVPPTAVTLWRKRQVRKKLEHRDLLWAGRRKIWYELSLVLSVVREAGLRRRIGVPISSTTISRAEQQRRATCT